MKVEIYSDVVCPWCAIGKARFDSALARFEHVEDVEVSFRSFELDPEAPRVSDEDAATRLATKYGMSLEQALASQERLAGLAGQEGLEFNFERSRRGNTFDAHRLLHLAGEVGLQGALKDRLMQAYFAEGAPIGDRETLVRLGAEVGLSAAKSAEVLESDRYGAGVAQPTHRPAGPRDQRGPVLRAGWPLWSVGSAEHRDVPRRAGDSVERGECGHRVSRRSL